MYLDSIEKINKIIKLLRRSHDEKISDLLETGYDNGDKDIDEACILKSSKIFQKKFFL